MLAGTAAFFTLEPLAADPKGEKDCGDVLPSLRPLQVRHVKAEPSWIQKGGIVNDASCLDRTSVSAVARPRSEGQLAEVLAYARATGLTISPAGVRHSMGGQAFRSGGIMLDMRDLNEIQVRPDRATITVGAGATWHDIQKAIHPRFAIKSMQSTDIFTVGGSISVDAHGMDPRAGAVMNSLQSMRVMLADGRVLTASRRHTRCACFIIGFSIFLVAWTVLNTVVLARRAFDPYPFIFLNLMLSMIAALQAPIIMMSQNRQAAKDRLEDRIDYETNAHAAAEIDLIQEKLDLLMDALTADHEVGARARELITRSKIN